MRNNRMSDMDSLLAMVAAGGSDPTAYNVGGRLMSAGEAQKEIQRRMPMQQEAEVEQMDNLPLWKRDELARQQNLDALTRLGSELAELRKPTGPTSDEGGISNWKFRPEVGLTGTIPTVTPRSLTSEQMQAATPEGIKVGRNEGELAAEEMYQQKMDNELALQQMKAPQAKPDSISQSERLKALQSLMKDQGLSLEQRTKYASDMDKLLQGDGSGNSEEAQLNQQLQALLPPEKYAKAITETIEGRRALLSALQSRATK